MRNGSQLEIAGRVFGRLTAIDSLYQNSNRVYIWLCKCQCGNHVETPVSDLLRGHSQSCGCLNNELRAKRWDGVNNPRFNFNKQVRDNFTNEAVKWRLAVFRRDNFTCDISGQQGGKLHAHHLNAWAWFPLQRCNLDNGITLSAREHRLFHHWMGGIDVKCTRADYERYKPMRIRELLTIGL